MATLAIRSDCKDIKLSANNRIADIMSDIIGLFRLQRTVLCEEIAYYPFPDHAGASSPGSVRDSCSGEVPRMEEVADSRRLSIPFRPPQDRGSSRGGRLPVPSLWRCRPQALCCCPEDLCLRLIKQKRSERDLLLLTK